MVQKSRERAEINSEEMPFSSEAWSQTPEEVQAFVVSALVRLQALETEVAELREQLSRNSHNSSQPPSSDGPEVERPQQGAKSGRKRGGQRGHPRASRKLLPLEQVKASYDLKPERCRACGQSLGGEDGEPYRHQVTEIPPVIAEVSEYRLHSLSCQCGTQTRAQLPAGVPQGAFGPRLQAMVSLLSGRYHLSKRDTAEIMADFFQAEMSLGSVSALEGRTSQAISQAVKEAQQHLKTQAVVHLDETGWRQANQKAWLWVAATNLVTVFLIRPSRGGKVAKEMLNETFKGIVVSDRWSAYNWLPTALRQLCWAHLRRDFQAFVERGAQSQAIGQAILNQADLMFDWWHKVRDGTMSRSTFQNNMQAVQTKVGCLLRQGTACNHSKTAGTCRDILKREAALWTFVQIEGVEPTNNLAERQIRPAVLWRKNSFGTQSETGSRFVQRIMTVVATLKQQHRHVLDYLTQACDAANWARQAPSLLPDDTIAG